MPCTVCFRPQWSDHTTCDGCGIAVHRVCVGAGSGSYLCPCCSMLGGSEVSCEICPLTSKDAVLVPLSDAGAAADAMAHYACVTWTPGLKLNADKSAASGIASIDTSRALKGAQCAICKKNRGYCLACAAPGCQQKVHGQ